jgi:hypothetical protein
LLIRLALTGALAFGRPAGLLGLTGRLCGVSHGDPFSINALRTVQMRSAIWLLVVSVKADCKHNGLRRRGGAHNLLNRGS